MTIGIVAVALALVFGALYYIAHLLQGIHAAVHDIADHLEREHDADEGPRRPR